MLESKIESRGPAFEVSQQADVITDGVAGSSTMIVSKSMPPFVDAGSSVEETMTPKVLEGVKVEGTRRTTTIPAGAIGNLQSIEIVYEQWYSPELRVTVMTRRFDPRFGETVYRLSNIQRAEPSPDLFKVPSDFRIEEVRPGLMMPVRPDGA